MAQGRQVQGRQRTGDRPSCYLGVGPVPADLPLPRRILKEDVPILGNGGGNWGDSRIEVTERLKELWNAEISQPYWIHGEGVDFSDWMAGNISALVE